MILGGGIITQALAGGGGSGGKVKPITITENGTYNVSEEEKAEGYVGFAPVTVDVPGGNTIAVPDIIGYFLEQNSECDTTLVPGYTLKLWSVPDGMFYTWDVLIGTAVNKDDNTSRPYLEQKYKYQYIMLGVFHGETLLYMFPYKLARRDVETYTLIAKLSENPEAATYKASDGKIIYNGYHLTWNYIFSDMVQVEIATDFRIDEVDYEPDGTIKSSNSSSFQNIKECVLPLYYRYPYGTSSGTLPVQWFSNLSKDNLINEMYLFGTALFNAYVNGYKPS